MDDMILIEEVDVIVSSDTFEEGPNTIIDEDFDLYLDNIDLGDEVPEYLEATIEKFIEIDDTGGYNDV